VWSSCVVVVSKCVCVLKSFTGLLPRSMLRIGHLPPLCDWRSSCRSLNVLLCLEVLSFALDLHPPKRCLLVSGWLHFLQSIGLCYVFFCIGIRVFPRLPHMSPVGICMGIVNVKERKKERKKSLTRGRVEDIGSTTDIQSYMFVNVLVC
jgi:hypothetical protein